MTVNGLTEKALANTLDIADNINARSSARFTFDSDNPIEVGQVVLIYDGATKIYGGTIDNYSLTYLRGSGGSGSRKRYSTNVIDFNQICDRRRVAASYEDETLSTIVNDIVSSFLTGEGITVGTIAKGTTVITKAVFQYITVSQALEYLRDAAGGDLSWNIDYNKELTFFQRADNTGVGFSDDNCLSLSVSETRQNYRNSQLLRAGDSTTETQVDEQPSPKPDGISRVFTVRLPLAKKPVIKINTVAVDPADIGILGLDIDKKWYWNKGATDIAQDEAETEQSATDAITVSYQGLVKILVQADNPTGQNRRKSVEGGTGIYQYLNEQLDLDNKEAAKQYANGLLVRYGTIPRNYKIESDTLRKAGQLIPIQSDNLDISEDALITNVSIKEITGTSVLRYYITAASGEDVGTWVEFFRSLKDTKSISISENEVLVLLQSIQDLSGWSGTTTVSSFALLFPSNTLFPSDTLYPNGNVISEVVLYD